MRARNLPACLWILCARRHTVDTHSLRDVTQRETIPFPTGNVFLWLSLKRNPGKASDEHKLTPSMMLALHPLLGMTWVTFLLGMAWL
jgi:hypothetical protein